MLASTWFTTNLVVHLFLLVPFIHGFLNFYIDRQEVHRLIGLSSDIYYVKDGVVQEYPLGFEMNIQPHICDLNFTWKNLIKKKMPYSITFHFDNLHVLGMTYMNISRQGFVPTEAEVFSIGFPCTGKEDAEVHVAINVNITVMDSHEKVFLTLRRNRICSAGLAHTVSEDAYHLLTSPSRRQLHSLYMALFFLFLFVFIFAIIIYCCTRICH